MWRLFIIILVVLQSSGGHCDCNEGWTEYSNLKKCYKVLDEFVTRENADILCAVEGSANETPVLLTILSPNEQAFIIKLLFEELQIFDSVWLGATRFNDTSFQWPGGENLMYKNWDIGYPTNSLSNNCAQITSSVSKGDMSKLAEGGLWRDVPCTKRNLVVCQQEDSSLSLEQLYKRLLKIEDNSVAVGFIYTQYAGKPDPEQLWPGLVWKSVTEEYAGRFFRAEGGGSAAFGINQEDNTRHLDEVNSAGPTPLFDYNIPVTSGSWSSYLWAGYYDIGGILGYEGIQFHLSQGEVRPINQAVRIWERIG